MLCLRLNLIKQKQISLMVLSGFFCLYLLFLTIITLFLIFHFGTFFLYFLFKEYNLQLVLREPQEILDILFGLSFWVAIFLFLWVFLFYINLFISSLLRKEEYFYYIFFYSLCFYFISLSIILFIYDLSFFHTDVFMQQRQFKFEPDILKWYSYYESEYVDFSLFLVLTLIVFFGALSYNYVNLISKTNLAKFMPALFLASLFCYFFGGESVIRDAYIVVFTFVFCEILNYTILLLVFLKRYK